MSGNLKQLASVILPQIYGLGLAGGTRKIGRMGGGFSVTHYQQRVSVEGEGLPDACQLGLAAPPW